MPPTEPSDLDYLQAHALVSDAMRRAVVNAGKAYHDPISAHTPDSAANPQRVRWRYSLDFWRSRHIDVSTRGCDHASMTDAERVALWHWLVTGEAIGKRASIFASALDVQRHVTGPWRDDAARVAQFCSHPVQFVERFFCESCGAARRVNDAMPPYFAPDTNLPHPREGVAYLQWRSRTEVPRWLRVCANSLGALAVETWEGAKCSASYPAATLNEETACRLWSWLHGLLNEPPVAPV